MGLKDALKKLSPIDYILALIALLSGLSIVLPRAYHYIYSYGSTETSVEQIRYIYNLTSSLEPQFTYARVGLIIALIFSLYRLYTKLSGKPLNEIRSIITSLLITAGIYASILKGLRAFYVLELNAYKVVESSYYDRRALGSGVAVAVLAFILAFAVFLIDVAQVSKYLSMRILQGAITVIIILVINFILFRSMPGNPILQRLMESRNVAKTKNITDVIQALEHMRGLDKPKWIQFVQYLRNMLIFRFGYAMRVEGGGRVRDILKFRLVNTVILMGASNTLSLLLGIGLGVIAARYRKTFTDAFLLFSSLFLYSVPAFRLGLLLLYVFAFQLGRFPIGGYVTPGTHGLAFVISYIHHMILPLVTLTLISYGGTLLITRSTLIDVFTEDYILTARAKGLDEKTVLYKHALRNAMLPLVTIIALSYAGIVSGAIITETLFNRPGVGRIMYDAYTTRDFPVLEAAFYITAILVVIANIIADILYTYLDPRVRL